MLASLHRLAIRRLLLLAILTVELVALTARYEVPTLFLPRLANNISWPAWLFHFSKEMWRAGLWVGVACIAVLIPRFNVILSDLRERSGGHRWAVWLQLHVLAFAAFLVVTSLIFERPTDPARITAPWFGGWFVLGGAALLSWLLAFAPSHFWMRQIRRHGARLFLGTLLGIGAWISIGMLTRQEAPFAQEELWNSLAKPTLRLVHMLLGWVFSDLVYQPETLLVGSPSFSVVISYACSGIEGISLITLFLAAYIWLFRKELRFPQAFWLFPVGIIAIWLTNAVRIAFLIIIGTYISPEVALQGFHAQAGWIMFTLVAVGAIILLHKLRFFTAMAPRASVARNDTLAAALLAPLLVLMAISMLTSAVSGRFDLLYPIRVLATAAILWRFRRHYSELGWAWSWQAAAVGVAVFLLWMLLEPPADSSTPATAEGLAELPASIAAVWLAFRVLGSVITVPLAEELAFRGYLIRKLVAEDFENVPFNQFAWRSFILSSVLFGLLHGRWLAGTLAGMGYALALYRRGQIGDAVIAHMTSNGLIALWVLSTGRWSLWS